MPESKGKQKGSKDEPQRIKLTAGLSITAYNAITEIQRIHRNETGKALPLWKVIDAAILDYYAKKHHVKTRP